MAESATGVILANRIKELRKSRGLLQRELAENLNCNRRAISYYERAERQPDASMVVAIADFFNVSLDYLYGRTDLQYPYDLLCERLRDDRARFTVKVADD